MSTLVQVVVLVVVAAAIGIGFFWGGTLSKRLPG